MLPGRRRLAGVDHRLHRADVFREAQVHFTLYGRPLTLVAAGDPGVMHWTYPLPMRIAGWRNIYTIHDVIPFDPTLASPVDGERLRRLLRELGRTADRFVAVSEAARQAVADALHCPPGFVANLSQAVDVAGAAQGPLPQGLATGGYFLFVGALERRKNLLGLIDAHARSGTRRPLVLVGPDGAATDEVMRRSAMAAGVVRLPFQPRGVVLQLIAGARALVLPSLAEGFGLPVAEAMALGTPVLASSGGALEEVAGGAGLLVNPLDIASMARAITRLDDDAALREALVRAGRRRAEAFAPPAYADRLLDCYREVCHD